MRRRPWCAPILTIACWPTEGRLRRSFRTNSSARFLTIPRVAGGKTLAASLTLAIEQSGATSAAAFLKGTCRTLSSSSALYPRGGFGGSRSNHRGNLIEKDAITSLQSGKPIPRAQGRFGRPSALLGRLVCNVGAFGFNAFGLGLPGRAPPAAQTPNRAGGSRRMTVCGRWGS
jgi:hypothetical protein